MERNTSKKANLILLSIIFILFILFLLFRSGLLSKTPEIQIQPKNTFPKTLVVITDADYSPYSFYDSNNKPSGHDIELINMICNDLQMNLDLKLMKWDEAIKAMEDGKADVLMTCDYSDSFKGVDKLTKTEPISSDDFIVYSKSKITSSDNLYNKRIAIMKNGNVLAEINKMNLIQHCIEYPDNRYAMKALLNDEVDCAIMRQTVGTVLIEDLSSKNIKGYTSIGKSNMCFGINEKDTELTEKINQILEQYKQEGKLQKLHNKWLTTFVRPYTLKETIINNTWAVFIFFLLVITLIFVIIKSEIQKIINKEELSRNAKIVEWLTQDFECVNYIILTENKVNDPVLNYRVSEKLKKLIPGWESEKFISHKLDLLRDNLVYKPDRKQFDIDVKRSNIIKELKESNVYYLNTRLFFDDEIHYYQMKFSPVYEGKKLKGIVTGLHSVDEQTKKEMALQEQLQNALKNAKVANKAKTDFLFNMSHDIRTPLNAITGFTNMAIKHIDDKNKALDCLVKTQQSGNLLLSLINSVLDVSRIESGKATVEKNKEDIFGSFTNIKSTMLELAASKNIKLSFEFKDIVHKNIICDINRCNRIFVNIVSNAIKYTNQGGFVKVKCTEIPTTSKKYAYYSYTFEDNGIGMSDEFQKHVFEKFSRENTSSTSDSSGTGLGMAVCKSFVDLMNGKIECKSKLGKGTTFSVTLPFEIQKQPSSKSSKSKSNNQADTFDKKDFINKKVLVTDDSPLNLEIAVDILKDEGFIVETANNGQEAINLLKTKGPTFYDFLLMDIRMPVMDGYDATKAIRKMYPNNKIPIIALSANAFEEDKKASLEAGMDAHIAKPINMIELFKTFSKFL